MACWVIDVVYMTTRIACRRAACVATRPPRRALLADDDASADQFTAGSSDSQTFQVQRLPASCVQPVQTTRSTCEHDVPLVYRHGGPQPALAVVRPTVSSYYDVELRQLNDDVSMSSCQQQTTLLWRHLAAVILAALQYLLQRCLNSAKSIAILFISMANSPGRVTSFNWQLSARASFNSRLLQLRCHYIVSGKNDSALLLPLTLLHASRSSNSVTDRISSKFVAKWQNNNTHTSNASLHYLLKYLCSKIAITQSWVKRTSMHDSAIQNSCSKYSPNDVSIIFFTDEKIFTMTTSKNPQTDRTYAYKLRQVSLPPTAFRGKTTPEFCATTGRGTKFGVYGTKQHKSSTKFWCGFTLESGWRQTNLT